MNDYPFSKVTQRTIRLISSARHKPPVLAKLGSSFGAISELEELESATSSRIAAQRDGLEGISADKLATQYGRTYINAAFAYPRPAGNRFNPDAWCAWYSAFTIETALQEVSFHLTRALLAANYLDNETRYVELHATFDDRFCDLRNLDPKPDCLLEDTSIAYPEGQKIAAKLREAGENGIVYPSARHAEGTCLVAFWPHLVTEFQQGAIWKLVWSGDLTPTITKESN